MFKLGRNVIGRRTFIRSATVGSGIALGLPLMEAMLDANGEALAQGAALPKRFISWFFGNGVNLDKFEPNAPGSSSWTPSELLQDLSDVKDYVTVCTGLSNLSTEGTTHHQGATMLSGYSPTRRPDLDRLFSTDYAGPTIDQVIAGTIAAEVSLPIPSLQMQISKFGSPVDGGTTSEVVSVKQAQGGLLPLPPVSNPTRIWRYLFGAPPAPSDVRASMLDFLQRDIGRMRNRLGNRDQIRMDIHLEGIRALEKKFGILDHIANQPQCAPPSSITETNGGLNGDEPLALVNELMAELTAVAFQCDLTRVASVLFLPIAGESTFGDVPNTIGPPTLDKTHHNWSHDQGPGYDTNVRHIMNQFGVWLRTFQARDEAGGGNLLDSSVLYATSEIANGNHQINRTPILLGGRGRGHFQYPGIHYQAIAGNGASLNNYSAPSAGNTTDVLLECLRVFDPGATSFGGGPSASGNVSVAPTMPLSAILA